MRCGAGSILISIDINIRTNNHMSSPELHRLNKVREQLSLERRKKSQDKLVQQKRMQFLDMSELLKETAMLQETVSVPPKFMSKQELLNRLEVERGWEFWQFISGVMDNEIKIKGASIFVTVWKEKCSLEKALWIAHQFLTKNPTVPSSQAASFKQILILCLRAKIDLDSYRSVLQCTNTMPNKEEVLKGQIDLFIQYLEMYQIDYFCTITTIGMVSQMINQLDEDAQPFLTSICSFTCILTKLALQTENQLLELVLYSLSSLILHGSSVVEILISSEFLRQCILVFEQSNVKIKNLLILIVYNTIIMGSPQQIVYLIENHLIDLVHYCIVSEFSMDCMHLCMRMYEKILKFVSGARLESGEERFLAMVEFIRIENLYQTMGQCEKSTDGFIREESAKIRAMIEDMMGIGVGKEKGEQTSMAVE